MSVHLDLTRIRGAYYIQTFQVVLIYFVTPKLHAFTEAFKIVHMLFSGIMKISSFIPVGPHHQEI